MRHFLLLGPLKLIFAIGLFCTIYTTILAANAESEVITTIILINSEAELVDVDLQGEVLKRYLAIPDYFSSGRSHTKSLRESLGRVKDYGFEEKSHFLPPSSLLPSQCLQSFMMTIVKEIKVIESDIFISSFSGDTHRSSDVASINHFIVACDKGRPASYGILRKVSRTNYYKTKVNLQTHQFTMKGNLWGHNLIKQRSVAKGRLYCGGRRIT